MENKWIPVEERLPEYRREVVLFCERRKTWNESAMSSDGGMVGVVVSAYRSHTDTDGEHYVVFGKHQNDIVRVISWQPYPDPPQP